MKLDSTPWKYDQTPYLPDSEPRFNVPLKKQIPIRQKNANGKVEYVASFFLVKPIDMSKASGLMWHDVPNRGRRVVIPAAERALGDVGLSSGWQGDNAGNTVPAANNDWVTVPIAKNPDGSPITGEVFGRIINRSGPNSQLLIRPPISPIQSPGSTSP